MATNPIVEAEEDFDNIDNVEDLTQRLGQELKSEEEQVEAIKNWWNEKFWSS